MGNWVIGDDPMLHDLWELQVDLEQGMLRDGAANVAEMMKKAQNDGEMTRVGPVRGLLGQWLPIVAKGLIEYRRDMKSRRGGPEPLALQYLTMLDPYVCSAVATKALLDGIGGPYNTRTNNVVPLAMSIGLTVEHECRVRKWEEQDPDLYHGVQHKLKRDKATHGHKRLVNIDRFNHLMRKGELSFTWQPWGKEAHFRVGAALLDIIIRTTGWFDLIDDPEHKYGGKGPIRAASKVIVPKPELSAWLAHKIAEDEMSHPVYQPTVIPPPRWDGIREGGYFTPFVLKPDLLRFKASSPEQQARAKDEYDAIDMPKVYEAINVLQETQWRVNRRVLEIANASWNGELGLGKMELQGDEGNRPLPPKPADIEEPAALRKWKAAAKIVHAHNAKRHAHIKAADLTIKTANRYQRWPFYFPHKLDWRGRIYPIPVHLQPQGSDLARGLLTFAKGLPITEDNCGNIWLALQISTFWGGGFDKQSFDERIAWAEANEELWLAIAEDPIACDQWSTGADKPWQALAAILEYAGFLKEGYGYVSHLPIMVDGTCNGLQHLSAMTRDEVAGEHVNLIPGEQPRDIYKLVAKNLQLTLERIEGGGGEVGRKATEWLDLLGRDIPRGFTKKQVMVLPYGGTRESFFGHTMAALDVLRPATQEELGSRDAMVERGRFAAFMVGHMWDEVKLVVRRGMDVMEWVQDCAKAVAKADQPIFWTTPCGMVVRHFYGKTVSRNVHIKLTGETCQLRVNDTTETLNIKKQIQGIAPNFIHSLDASALVDCVIVAKENGVSSFTSIHDAYGTHAANMFKLGDWLREAFVETHESEPLAGFRAACQSVLVSLYVSEGMEILDAAQKADGELPVPLELGNLALREILQSDYFFA